MNTNTQSDLTQILDEERDRAKTLSDRITSYLVGGGLFNPEMMEHEKVRDLMMSLRTFLDTKPTALVKALRRAERDLKIFGARWTLDDITAILNQGRKD